MRLHVNVICANLRSLGGTTHGIKEAFEMVKCCACNTDYPSAYAGSDQCGQGCSSEVAGNRLIGGYGSRIADGLSYTISEDAGLKDHDALCDQCIEDHIANGLLTLEPIHRVYHPSQMQEEASSTLRDTVASLLGEISEFVEASIPNRPLSA